MACYDPYLNRKTYSIRQIAASYQGSHVSVWNMPCDDEFLFALKINGHDASRLDDVKNEYIRRSEAIAPYNNR